MLVAYLGPCNERDTLAVRAEKPSNHGRVALLRDRLVRSGVTSSTRMHSKSAISSVAAVYDRRLKKWKELLRMRMRARHPLPTLSTLTESPVRAAHSSPGSASLRAQPWVKIYLSSAVDSEAARSANFIRGHQTGPSPTRHKPKIRPQNKGIKPKSNRHRPKKFIITFRVWWLSVRIPCANLRNSTQTCATPYPPFLSARGITNPYSSRFFRSNLFKGIYHHHFFIFMNRWAPIQGKTRQYKTSFSFDP